MVVEKNGNISDRCAHKVANFKKFTFVGQLIHIIHKILMNLCHSRLDPESSDKQMTSVLVLDIGKTENKIILNNDLVSVYGEHCADFFTLLSFPSGNKLTSI